MDASKIIFSISFQSKWVKMVGGLTQEWILKALVNLGFKLQDAQVYLFLALSGPKKAKDIAETLNLYKQQVYRSLRSLKAKGMVSATLGRPARFSVVSLEKVLDIFMRAKTEQAKDLQSNR